MQAIQRRSLAVTLALSLALSLALAGLAGCGDDAASDADGGDDLDASVGDDDDDDDDSDGDAGPGCNTGSNLIYMSRTGGTYTGGNEDSSLNTSTLVVDEVVLEPWDIDDDTWEAFLSCIAATYQRYDVRVVDVDPGAAVHTEVVITGNFEELGFPQNVTGVAPNSGCTAIPDATVFYNGPIYGTAGDVMCDDISRSIANSLGLDIIFADVSVMSYLPTSSYPRSFIDGLEQCGETEPRECNCGGATQNSHAELVGHLGACGGT